MQKILIDYLECQIIVAVFIIIIIIIITTESCRVQLTHLRSNLDGESFAVV